jgi:N-methylhydantoinase A
LTVGPKSAGAHPGPVCYERGGTQPTIVDANLVLGLMDPGYFLGGRVKLNKSKAEEAIKKKLAEPLGMDVTDVAAGIYDIANAHMSDLIRKQIMPLGLEPSRYIIYAYGGTGPVHAAAYAAELGIEKVYVFPTSPTFSAMGAAIADVIVSDVVSYQLPMPADLKVLNEKVNEMHSKLYDAMKRQGVERDEVQFRHIFYMRYRKQLNELPVDIPVKMEYDEKDIREIMDVFDQKYEETYGTGAAYKQAGMEVISIQMDAIKKGETIKLREVPEGEPDPSKAIKGERKACFAGRSREFVSTSIYDYYKLTAGNIIKGPGIIESPLNTVVIPPGSKGRIDQYLNIEITVRANDA